ncbi:hypothetical protein SAY86_015693 [Trapa natans]|uniref:Uncharacterized protein n=1 Tax=Trapa natans TaxID=22666 RepID=A0AAN7QYQ1_TRANT|nr:hypothetical protein SAY86_015633 [Trapa natans]KAK4781591.1 hypothetical protein SAY86_015693 [Trapa natans]
MVHDPQVCLGTTLTAIVQVEQTTVIVREDDGSTANSTQYEVSPVKSRDDVEEPPNTEEVHHQSFVALIVHHRISVKIMTIEWTKNKSRSMMWGHRGRPHSQRFIKI